jgi:hypothetical protein
VLKRFLESQGVAIDDRRFAALRRARPADYVAQKFARLLSRMTRHFPAVHKTWGAINELSTLTGYHALIDRTRHPLLTAMLSRPQPPAPGFCSRPGAARQVALIPGVEGGARDAESGQGPPHR